MSWLEDGNNWLARKLDDNVGRPEFLKKAPTPDQLGDRIANNADGLVEIATGRKMDQAVKAEGERRAGLNAMFSENNDSKIIAELNRVGSEHNPNWKQIPERTLDPAERQKAKEVLFQENMSRFNLEKAKIDGSLDSVEANAAAYVKAVDSIVVMAAEVTGIPQSRRDAAIADLDDKLATRKNDVDKLTVPDISDPAAMQTFREEFARAKMHTGKNEAQMGPQKAALDRAGSVEEFMQLPTGQQEEALHAMKVALKQDATGVRNQLATKIVDKGMQQAELTELGYKNLKSGIEFIPGGSAGVYLGENGAVISGNADVNYVKDNLDGRVGLSELKASAEKYIDARDALAEAEKTGDPSKIEEAKAAKDAAWKQVRKDAAVTLREGAEVGVETVLSVGVPVGGAKGIKALSVLEKDALKAEAGVLRAEAKTLHAAAELAKKQGVQGGVKSAANETATLIEEGTAPVAAGLARTANTPAAPDPVTREDNVNHFADKVGERVNDSARRYLVNLDSADIAALKKVTAASANEVLKENPGLAERMAENNVLGDMASQEFARKLAEKVEKHPEIQQIVAKGEGVAPLILRDANDAVLKEARRTASAIGQAPGAAEPVLANINADITPKEETPMDIQNALRNGVTADASASSIGIMEQRRIENGKEVTHRTYDKIVKVGGSQAVLNYDPKAPDGKQFSIDGVIVTPDAEGNITLKIDVNNERNALPGGVSTMVQYAPVSVAVNVNDMKKEIEAVGKGHDVATTPQPAAQDKPVAKLLEEQVKLIKEYEAQKNGGHLKEAQETLNKAKAISEQVNARAEAAKKFNGPPDKDMDDALAYKDKDMDKEAEKYFAAQDKELKEKQAGQAQSRSKIETGIPFLDMLISFLTAITGGLGGEARKEEPVHHDVKPAAREHAGNANMAKALADLAKSGIDFNKILGGNANMQDASLGGNLSAPTVGGGGEQSKGIA